MQFFLEQLDDYMTKFTKYPIIGLNVPKDCLSLKDEKIKQVEAVGSPYEPTAITFTGENGTIGEFKADEIADVKPVEREKKIYFTYFYNKNKIPMVLNFN